MKLILLFFAFMSLASLAFSQSDRETEYLSQAQAAMNSGDFTEAASYYESAIFSGHENGHVYYNYGIALFRNGDLGSAMAAFLASRRYLPRNADVKANLSYVHGSIKDDLSYEFEPPLWAKMFFWLPSFSQKEQYNAAVAFLFLCTLCFAMFQFRLLSTLSVWIGSASFVVTLVLFAGFAVDKVVSKKVGAVQTDVASAYSGPSEKGNSVVFQVSQGSPVKILESDDEWAKVAISDGKRGWIAKSQIRVF